jgi:hypothetical protein
LFPHRDGFFGQFILMSSSKPWKCEERGYKTAREQLSSVRGEKLKPDLVVTDGERALIVDVTVRFESGDSLARGSIEKITKYQPLADYFVSQGTAREAKVLPIVIGSRGAVPKDGNGHSFVRQERRHNCQTG